MNRKLPPTAFFTDGVKEIDFIFLEKVSFGENELEKRGLINQFDNAVEEEGLLIEKETSSQQTFTKIHAPLERLLHQAELEGIELGVLPCDLPKPGRYWFWKLIPCEYDPFKLPESLKIPVKGYFTKPYVNSNRDEFSLSVEPFTAAQRKFLVQRILQDIFIPCKELKGGYNYMNLLENKIYEDAFIPHDSDLVKEAAAELPPKSWPQRQYLAFTWASWKRTFQYQPLDQIRSYFGEQVAFYFAWLGFYTKLLCLPSALGVIVLIISSILSRDDAVAFCSPLKRNLPFCRSCASTACHFREAGDLCMPARISKIFEHPLSQLFSLFMVVWSRAMLDKWEQYQNTLAQRWSVKAIETYAVEKIRPEYRRKVDSERLNLVTLETEPYLSTRSASIRFLSSASTVIFFICVVLALILATITYKQNAHLILEATHWFSYMDETGMQQFVVPPTMFTTITSSCLTVAIMTIMGRIYAKLAYWLTKMELPRTQQDFEYSFTYKLVVFQFVNYYGTVAYMALIRPFIQHNPLSVHNHDACPPHGCMYDLVFQMLIIMIFKQAANNVVEFSLPRIKRLLSTRTCSDSNEPTNVVNDVGLAEPDDPQLLPDHMELLIQFGYVVMFAGVMPLLPLFALFNNVLETRIDADKYIRQTRRLMPTRVRNIQPWLVLLRTLSSAAIFTNAFIFAFSTSLPGALLVYLQPSQLKTDTSYVELFYWNDTVYTDYNETFPIPAGVTSQAKFDWAFRFRVFPTLKLCYVYDEDSNVVDDQTLAAPPPPTVDQLERWLDIPVLNLAELTDGVRPNFDRLGAFFNHSLYMEQCRGGILYSQGGHQVEQHNVERVRKKVANLTATWGAWEDWPDYERLEMPWMARDSLRGLPHLGCWANYDVTLVNNTLVTSEDYYRVRYVQHTCAVVFILVASVLQAVSQYLVPEQSEMDRVHEQRKHYVFRQQKRGIDFKAGDSEFSHLNSKLHNRKPTHRRRAQSCEPIDESQRQRLID